MDAARDDLAAAGCSILVISQAKPEVLSRYLARRSWNVPIVSDPDRVAYRAFGLERTGWSAFFRPAVLWGYLRGMIRGYGLKAPSEGEDVLQLGGDFILDKLGRVRFAYPSSNPADRPGLDTIREALAKAGKGSEP